MTKLSRDAKGIFVYGIASSKAVRKQTSKTLAWAVVFFIWLMASLTILVEFFLSENPVYLDIFWVSGIALSLIYLIFHYIVRSFYVGLFFWAMFMLASPFMGIAIFFNAPLLQENLFLCTIVALCVLTYIYGLVGGTLSVTKEQIAKHYRTIGTRVLDSHHYEYSPCDLLNFPRKRVYPGAQIVKWVSGGVFAYFGIMGIILTPKYILPSFSGPEYADEARFAVFHIQMGLFVYSRELIRFMLFNWYGYFAFKRDVRSGKFE